MTKHSNEGDTNLGFWSWKEEWDFFYKRKLYDRSRTRAGENLIRLGLRRREEFWRGNLKFLIASDVLYGALVSKHGCNFSSIF